MNASTFLCLRLLVLLEDSVVETDHVLAFVMFEQLESSATGSFRTSAKH